MNRRAVLVGLPATVLGVNDAQVHETESPVMAVFRTWKTVFDFVEGPALRGLPDDEYAPFHEHETELVSKIIRMPARNALDVCAKLTAFTCDGQYFADDGGLLSDMILREARRMVSNVHQCDENS